MQSVRRLWIWFREDWRVRAIFIATIIAVVITGLGYWNGLGENANDHKGALFASWAASVALFVVVGITSAIASLVSHAGEPFDARARILFGGKRGSHIDYIINRLPEIFEHYAEETSIELEISEYDEQDKKYLVLSKNSTSVRSYLGDISTTYQTAISADEVTPPPAGKASNMLRYISINGSAQKDCSNVEFNNCKLEHQITTKINANEVVTVDHSIQYWICANSEPLVNLPIRFTQKLTLNVRNLTKIPKLKVRLIEGKEGIDTTHFLEVGTVTALLKNKDYIPNKPAYTLYIEAP